MEEVQISMGLGSRGGGRDGNEDEARWGNTQYVGMYICAIVVNRADKRDDSLCRLDGEAGGGDVVGRFRWVLQTEYCVLLS